jgi:CheY-like chemotaxis protein
MASDVLDQGKLQAGKMLAIHETFDMSRLVEDCLLLFGKQTDPARVTIRWQKAEDVPALVVGDEKKISQILGNLLSNAVKYTEQGEIVVSLAAESLGADKLWLRLEVTDTGLGIAAEESEKIFVAFEQTKSAQSSLTRSSGLGLYLTKQLVELLGGEIFFTSQQSVGTRFSVRLPLGLIPEGKLPRPHSPIVGKRVPTLSPKFPGRVLVVDDDPVNLEVARRQLQRLNSDVTAITNPKDALPLLAGQTFDLVLLDYHFPDQSGADLLKAWRADARFGRYTPVVALTAMARQDTRELVLSEGFDDYLAKPVGLDDMAKLVGRWVPVSRTTRPLAKSEKKSS